MHVQPATPRNLQRARLRREEEEAAAAALAARAKARVASAAAQLSASGLVQRQRPPSASHEPGTRFASASAHCMPQKPSMPPRPTAAAAPVDPVSTRLRQSRLKAAWAPETADDGLPQCLFFGAEADEAQAAAASPAEPPKRSAAGILSGAAATRAVRSARTGTAAAAAVHGRAPTDEPSRSRILSLGVEALPPQRGATRDEPGGAPSHGGLGGADRSDAAAYSGAAASSPPSGPLDEDALEEAEVEAEAVQTAAALTAARRQLELALKQARARTEAEASGRAIAETRLSAATARAEEAEAAAQSMERARAAAEAQVARASEGLAQAREHILRTSKEGGELRSALESAAAERAQAAAMAELAEEECAAACAARDVAVRQAAVAEARVAELSLAWSEERDAALRAAERPSSCDAATEPCRELVIAEQSAAAKLEVMMHELRVVRGQRDSHEERHADVMNRIEQHGGKRLWSGVQRVLHQGGAAAEPDLSDCEGEGGVGRRRSPEAARQLAMATAMARWYRASEARRVMRLRAATKLQAHARGRLARRRGRGRGQRAWV